MKTVFRFSMLLVILMAILSQQSNAANPMKPENFKAQVISGDNFSTHISLTWERPNDIDRNGQFYQIFYVEKDNYREDYVGFHKFPNTVAENWDQDDVTRELKIKDFKAGTYAFYVNFAAKGNGQIISGENTVVQWVSISKEDNKTYITFKAQNSPYEAKVNNPFKMTFEVSTNGKCNINTTVSVLEGKFTDYNFDNNTRTITLTPMTAGYIYLTVYASLECDPNVTAKQTYKIIVSGDSNSDKEKGTVYGSISFENGEKVLKNGIVNVFPASILNSTTTEGVKPIASYEFHSNQFKLPIVANQDVVLQFTAEGVETEFWENSEVPYKATPVIVKAGEIKQIAVVLKLKDGTNPDDTKGKATFEGIIVTSDGQLIENAYVYLYPIKANTNSGDLKSYNFSAREGKFEFAAKAGYDYIMQVQAKGYAPYWYENADKASAKVITTNEGETYSFRIVLEKLAEPKMVTVSGRVTDKESNEGIQAYVYFFSSDLIFGGKNNPNPNGQYEKIMAKTDEHGNYSIHLPELHSFIAQAYSINGKTYQTQYYFESSDMYASDIIYTKSDVSDINFALVKDEKNHSDKVQSFNLYVKDTDGNAVQSNVTALMVNKGGNNTNQKYKLTAMTDENGMATFKALPYGDYIFFSAPSDRKFIPGYYVQGTNVTLKWREATMVSVGENMIDIVFQATHQLVDKAAGIADVNGKVSGKGGITVGKDGQSAGGASVLSGALVYITDMNGKVVDYAFTDKNGSFLLSEIENGTYNLVSDAVGYVENSMYITVGAGKDVKVETDVVLDAAISSVDDIMPESAISIYPNPANAVFNLSGELENSFDLRITDMMGKVVFSSDKNNATTFNISNLSPGVYNVMISQNQGISIERLVITR